MELENQEFVKEFVEEALGHLQTVENGLIALDEQGGDDEVIHGLFRSLHSIKGTAGFFGLKNIVELAHSMENLFGELRNGRLPLREEMIDGLLRAADTLKEMVENVESSDGIDISYYIEMLKGFMEQKDERKKELSEPVENAEERSWTSRIPQDSHSEEMNKVPLAAAPGINDTKDTPAKGAGKTAILQDESIRVHVNLLNDLMDLASELVLGRNQLLRAMEGRRKSVPGLESILQNIDHLTTEMQEKIMQTRMQPLENVTKKFPRLLRDVSKQLQKEIRLEIEGSDVELDKSIIEALTDPLTHLLRNAADHGIESPEERGRAGKPREGVIRLEAYHEAGHVTIDITDDGRGMDAGRLMAHAQRKGIVDGRELEGMGESDALSLVFRPGFSTAERITDISGRGVGMDVVKTNIERLGGTIDILSSLGKGTTFRLNLPLTLAIIPSLIVEAQGEKFALPQINIKEMVRVKPGDTDRKIEMVQNTQVLRLRSQLLPLVQLADALGVNEGMRDSKEGDGQSEILRILVVKSGIKQFGLVVDAIHDGEEILVKPLPRFLKECRSYSGVTILGDGSIAMILDMDGIADKAALRFSEETHGAAENTEEEINKFVLEQQKMMLFRCSGPETLALHLSMVARVESIAASQIQRIGEKEYMQFQGGALRIIRPEQFLPISCQENSRDKYMVIIPKLVRHPIGLLIQEMDEVIESTVDLQQNGLKVKGLAGNLLWKERIVLLLNLYQLFEMAAPEHYQTTGEVKASGNNHTLLLAEDTPFFRKIVKSDLEEAGYKVITAENGKEALELLRVKKVDALISDIHMPVMDGIELVQRIRQSTQLETLPIIALTSLEGEGHIHRGMEAGFDFYETKLDKERLLRTLEEAIGERRSGHGG